MSAEQIEAGAAVATFFAGHCYMALAYGSECDKISRDAGNHTSDVATLKTETQYLRDSHVRTDTLIGTITAKLDKLNQVDRLASNVEVMRSIVDRLDTQVAPRPDPRLFAFRIATIL